MFLSSGGAWVGGFINCHRDARPFKETMAKFFVIRVRMRDGVSFCYSAKFYQYAQAAYHAADFFSRSAVALSGRVSSVTIEGQLLT